MLSRACRSNSVCRKLPTHLHFLLLFYITKIARPLSFTLHNHKQRGSKNQAAQSVKRLASKNNKVFGKNPRAEEKRPVILSLGPYVRLSSRGPLETPNGG